MSLIEFLKHAELQVETGEQRAELAKALHDMAELPARELAEMTYSDYEGNPGQWSAVKILTAYFYSPHAPSLEDAVLEELEHSEVRNTISQWAKAMVDKCVHHPGRPSAGVKFGRNYCQICINGINTAGTRVDKHVEPKVCFVVFKGGDKWDPIPGTGCAHWVAHQVGISRGENCSDERTLRVPQLISGLTKVSRDMVAVNDIWANPNEDHCGLVVKVESLPGSPPNRITIRHDSSAQGGVKDNDFDSYFKADGTFNR